LRASKETLNNLDKLVKERTAELEEAYKSLKESEARLSEAQKMANIGNWDLDLVTGKVYWSDQTFRIFGYLPQKFKITFDNILNHVHPNDLLYVENSFKEARNENSVDIDYRIILANGKERIVHTYAEFIRDEKNIPLRMKGTIQDITERKKAEDALAKIESARKQEIHHRIKNNLQVISSLLDLQAEQFRNRADIKDSEVLNAFKESQDRVVSMALIHEELYKGRGFETLNISPYIEELADNLFRTYRLGNVDISLNLDLEGDIFFDMDTAVPLGMIINELLSNSLKYAFRGRDKGEILIKLFGEENAECINSIEERRNEDCESTRFTLTISDNGVGIPENIDIEELDSLGLQLVTTLVDQLDGELELKRNSGTEFTMRFTVNEKNNMASESCSLPTINRIIPLNKEKKEG
jgi:PAS domain S-box-containing protein